MNTKHAARAYRQHITHLKNKVDRNGMPVEMRMTFEEWCKVWADSGKWELRGRGAGRYVMSRHGDVGHYEVGNVFIQDAVDNIRQAGAQISRGVKKHFSDPSARAKQSVVAKEAQNRPEVKAKQAATNATLETKQRRSAASKKRMSDQTVKSKVAAGMNALYADPVRKAEYLARRRETYLRNRGALVQ